MQRLIEVGQNISRCNVHIRYRFSSNDHPFCRGRCIGHRAKNLIAEGFRVGEKKRCVPAKEHKARYLFCLRIAGYIVIALQTFHMPEHGIIRAPRAPDKSGECQTDGNEDALDDAQQNHT